MIAFVLVGALILCLVGSHLLLRCFVRCHTLWRRKSTPHLAFVNHVNACGWLSFCSNKATSLQHVASSCLARQTEVANQTRPKSSTSMHPVRISSISNIIFGASLSKRSLGLPHAHESKMRTWMASATWRLGSRCAILHWTNCINACMAGLRLSYSSYFSSSLKIEYSYLVIKILSFILLSSAPILLHFLPLYTKTTTL